MSFTLYELAQDYQNFLAAIETGDIPEEAIADTLEAITAELDDKADNIACLIKNLLSEADAIKAEEAKLTERRRQKERQAESIKNYLSETLQRTGRNKIETARNKISFRKSESVAVDNEADFIEWARINRNDLLTYKEPTINRTEVKRAIANGAEIAGVHIETKQNIQIK